MAQAQMVHEKAQAIRSLVSRCDLGVVDLDECIYPLFTQSTLGALLFLVSLRARRRLLPQLLGGAAYITATRLVERLGRKPTNFELMGAFSRVTRGAPIGLVDECAGLLPRLGPQGWRRALGRVADGMDLHLVTFSIDPIARAYAEARDDRGRAIFQGYRATPIAVVGGVVEGCVFTEASLSPAAKVAALDEIIEERGRAVPLVIGHGADEAGLVERARSLGGGSIGLVGGGADRVGFDVTLPPSSGWGAIARALATPPPPQRRGPRGA